MIKKRNLSNSPDKTSHLSMFEDLLSDIKTKLEAGGKKSVVEIKLTPDQEIAVKKSLASIKKEINRRDLAGRPLSSENVIAAIKNDLIEKNGRFNTRNADQSVDDLCQSYGISYKTFNRRLNAIQNSNKEKSKVTNKIGTKKPRKNDLLKISLRVLVDNLKSPLKEENNRTFLFRDDLLESVTNILKVTQKLVNTSNKRLKTYQKRHTARREELDEELAKVKDKINI